ncbi:MAG: DUF5654 family protein [archaeon]
MTAKKKPNEPSKNETIYKLKGELDAIKKEIQHDVTGPVVASFGFIIALVWRDAIKGAIDEYLIKAGLIEKAYFYNFISAVVITIIVIAIMVIVTKLGRSKKAKRIEKAIEKKIEMKKEK